jgi:hypothetical protein
LIFFPAELAPDLLERALLESGALTEIVSITEKNQTGAGEGI